MTERERALLQGKKISPLTANESALAYAVAHGGGSEPTYETVAEIQVGTMVENHGLYMFQLSDSIPLARNETLFFNSEEYPLEYAEEAAAYYYNFDVSTGAATGTPAYVVSIDGDLINGLISDTPDLSNTTVRILKKVEQGGGGELPENLKPTYEFDFSAEPGEGSFTATPASGVTYAAIASALAETPHVFAKITFPSASGVVVYARFNESVTGDGQTVYCANDLVMIGGNPTAIRLDIRDNAGQTVCVGTRKTLAVAT